MNSTVNNTWCRGTTGLTEGDDGGGRVSHCLGGLMAQEAGCSLPAGARTPKAILKSEPLYARTHTRTRSCSKPWQKMTDTVVAEGQVKFRDGKKVNSTYLRLIFHFKCAPMPLGQIQESPLWFTSFQTSSQWKTRWVVLRKPSPVAGSCLFWLHLIPTQILTFPRWHYDLLIDSCNDALNSLIFLHLNWYQLVSWPLGCAPLSA